MEGITSSLAKPTQMRRDGKPRPRSEAKRARIVEVAIRHFAERGYSAARVEDIAAQLGIAKGSVFQHFKSKDGLFFEAYKKAVRSFPKYMQAPAAVQDSLSCCGTGWGAPRTWCGITGRHIGSIWLVTMERIWRCGGRLTGFWWRRILTDGANL
jgi:AcrR family transcriptional regulator